MSKFSEMLNRKRSEKASKSGEPRGVDVIQMEYNNACAQLGQDIVRIADLAQATEQLTKAVEDHKRKIFSLLKEIPAAQEYAKKKAAEAKKEETHAQSNP
jgi:predicted TIM-barrel fold metal-dependent hydrolase